MAIKKRINKGVILWSAIGVVILTMIIVEALNATPAEREIRKAISEIAEIQKEYLVGDEGSAASWHDAEEKLASFKSKLEPYCADSLVVSKDELFDIMIREQPTLIDYMTDIFVDHVVKNFDFAKNSKIEITFNTDKNEAKAKAVFTVVTENVINGKEDRLNTTLNYEFIKENEKWKLVSMSEYYYDWMD